MKPFFSFSRLTPLIVSGAALISGLVGQPSTLQATQVITSDPFTIFYGYDNDGSAVPKWLEISTPSATGTTQGNFTFSPIVTSTKASDYGFIFTNGVPTYSEPQYSFSSHSGTFALDITAKYTGPKIGTNYQIKLVITSISIWGVSFDNQSSFEMAFQETTTGHEATSPDVSLKAVPASAANLRPLNNYTLLEWAPADFFTPGDTQNRTFKLTDGRIVDGLTINGYIELSYEAIPEPSSVKLGFFVGGAALLALARTRNKCIKSRQ